MVRSESTPAPSFPWRFFVLAFAISWLFWVPGVLDTLGLITLPVPFIILFFVGTWGPFFAAVTETYRGGGGQALKRFLRRGLDWRIPRL